MLLQFSVISKKFYEEHASMIDEFVERCSKDPDRVASLFEYYSSVGVFNGFSIVSGSSSDPHQSTQNVITFSGVNNFIQLQYSFYLCHSLDSLFEKPVPFSLLPFQQQLDIRKGPEPAVLPSKVMITPRTLQSPNGCFLVRTLS